MQAALGLATLLMAWKTRSVFSEFNESATILLVTCLVGLAATILIAIKATGAVEHTGTVATLQRSTEFVFEVRASLHHVVTCGHLMMVHCLTVADYPSLICRCSLWSPPRALSCSSSSAQGCCKAHPQPEFVSLTGTHQASIPPTTARLTCGAQTLLQYADRRPCLRGRATPTSFEEWKRALGGKVDEATKWRKPQTGGGSARSLASLSRLSSTARSQNSSALVTSIRIDRTDVEVVSATAATSSTELPVADALPPAESPAPVPEAAELAWSAAQVRVQMQRISEEHEEEEGAYAQATGASDAQATGGMGCIASGSALDGSLSRPAALELPGCSRVVEGELSVGNRLSSVLLPSRRVWVSFHSWSGAWVNPEGGLEDALSLLISEDRKLTQLQSEGTHTRHGFGKLSVGSRRDLLLSEHQGADRGSTKRAPSILRVFQRGASTRRSVESAPAALGSLLDAPAPGEDSILAVNLSLGGESVTLPVDKPLRSLTPARLVGEPGLLLKLVNERLEQRRARIGWLEGARAERVRAGRLQAATRTVHKGLRMRIKELPLQQRMLMLTMLVVSLLMIGDGSAALANFFTVEVPTELITGGPLNVSTGVTADGVTADGVAADPNASTLARPLDGDKLAMTDEVRARQLASVLTSGVALILTGVKMLLCCSNPAAELQHQRGCVMVGVLVLVRALALWAVDVMDAGASDAAASPTLSGQLHVAVLIGLLLLLPLASLLLRIMYREYGWRSFSHLARLDISLELHNDLCALHASLIWCLLTAVVHFIALCAGGHGGLSSSGLVPLLLGFVWAAFLVSWSPTGVVTRVLHLDRRLQRCSHAVHLTGKALMLTLLVVLPLAEPAYLAVGFIARASALRDRLGGAHGALCVMLVVEEASFTAGGCLAFGVSLYILSRLWNERKALIALQHSLSMLRKASLRHSSDVTIEGSASLHALVASSADKLPARVRRHVTSVEQENALAFCRRGCNVHLLMQGEASVAIRRHKRFLQLTADMNSLRWSWTNSLHVDQIQRVHLHAHAPLKMTISFSALNAASDMLSLGVEAQSAEHARSWVCALGVLMRSATARDACLPDATLRDIRNAFQASAKHNESLETTHRQLSFFRLLVSSNVELELGTFACAPASSQRLNAQP